MASVSDQGEEDSSAIGFKSMASVSDQGEEDSATIEFQRFDIVSDVSDHRYQSSNKSGKDKSFTNVNCSVNRKIMREWQILESDLPDSIYVRAYETRIDLLRAVIIGPRGTPYHDGLFFFDIAFPSDYPKHPPKVYYHSYGFRLNPNLYQSGYVCLSLINTWTGSKSEKWTPATSTILQLLVSIQGLVLNDRPYFNEPGFEVGKNNTTESWLKKSLNYNEDAFILSCKTMICNLRNPPKNFESFVTGHFSKRAEFILAAIKEYGDGACIVGQYTRDGLSSSGRAQLSSNFKANADKIYSALEGTFKNMANCPLSVKSSGSEENAATSKSLSDHSGKRKVFTTSKPQAIAKKPKNGAWKKFTCAFKWLLK